jgi:uncharacterized protein GlcG (DUF336 family)
MSDDRVLAGSTLSLRAARAVVDAALAAAERLGVTVVVWVVDPGGHDIAMARMDDSPLLSRQVARDQAGSCVAFGQPTTWWARIIDDDPTLAALGRGNRLMPVAGGVPLRVEGVLVGGLGVSGAGADDDGAIADAGAAVLEHPLP